MYRVYQAYDVMAKLDCSRTGQAVMRNGFTQRPSKQSWRNGTRLIKDQATKGKRVIKEVSLLYCPLCSPMRPSSPALQRPHIPSAVSEKNEAKSLLRQMLAYWKKNEKDELVARKKAEKEAVDRAKAEEELREARRQSRKLNFLLTQTELYSHFIGKKIKTAEAEGGMAEETPRNTDAHLNSAHVNEELGLDDQGEPLPDIDYDDGSSAFVCLLDTS